MAQSFRIELRSSSLSHRLYADWATLVGHNNVFFYHFLLPLSNTKYFHHLLQIQHLVYAHLLFLISSTSFWAVPLTYQVKICNSFTFSYFYLFLCWTLSISLSFLLTVLSFSYIGSVQVSHTLPNLEDQTKVLKRIMLCSWLCSLAISVNIVTGLWAGWLGFDFWQRSKFFLHATMITLALGSTQTPIQWVPGFLSPGVKWLVCDADHLPPSCAEVKNVWSYTPTRPI
jgi:hypothetical protein